VSLLSCNNDPLGTIAAAALMYEGKSVESLELITDDQRRYYLDQVQKSVLEAPLEFVNFHFIINGVTRGFTHQMVRQRTATYTQESTRFAVKEDVPVGLPPSLTGTVPWSEWLNKCAAELYPLAANHGADESMLRQDVINYAQMSATPQQIWRRDWDDAVSDIGVTYNALVDAGMPAEDARGLLPTNLLTRINYNTSMRGLKEHAGVRLCTQAQYEWRLVWMEMLKAIREYGKTQTYNGTSSGGVVFVQEPASWQFNALADVFKPICYARGKCQFMADVDRACSIRERVNRHAELGTPSADWRDIEQGEWMFDPSAARVKG
jgi:flavin-dependent thymidylate synthase